MRGPTGLGKSFLASALGHQACQLGYRVYYRNCSKLFDELKIAKADGSYIKEINRIEKIDLLVMDDFGLKPLDTNQRLLLLELLEDRHGKRSTIITSQLPVKSWYEVIGEPTIADAILDRLVQQHIASKKPHKRKNKNSITNTDMNQLGYQYFEGVDLMAIEGFNDGIIMSLISEVGLEGIKKSETAKQFTSWLRLAPNNKISGGKILSHHIPKGSSRLKIAFRNAANAIGQLKEGWLVDFFRRIIYKKGRATAISALARKLAVIVWNMVVKGVPYQPPTQYLFLDQKRKLGIVKRIQKQITKFELTSQELGFVTN